MKKLSGFHQIIYGKSCLIYFVTPVTKQMDHGISCNTRKNGSFDWCCVDFTGNFDQIMKRESFKSRLGFILVSAGCAFGIGNVWRFPNVVGENGGGLFVLLYLVFLIAMGLPVLTMELAVGRASRKSAVLGYKALEKPGSKWHLHGWAAIFGCYMLMM